MLAFAPVPIQTERFAGFERGPFLIGQSASPVMEAAIMPESTGSAPLANEQEAMPAFGRSAPDPLVTTQRAPLHWTACVGTSDPQDIGARSKSH